jgi:filamentous hemagglutinin family protein
MANRKLDKHPLNSVLRAGLARTAAGALGAATPLMALANPTGGQVVAGSASISNPAANGTVVNQNTQRAVIDWQSFSVGSGQYVQFVQPNSSSVVLNKVIGGTPSSIFGDIKANGQVFLVNPNGIYFAPGASIDVQGLVASTLDMNSAAFMRGKYQFSRADGSSAATVVNQGSIVTGRGGYVVLAGDYVQNDGAINAQAGRVVLAAGNNATLTLDKSQLVSYVVNSATLAHLAGVENTGTITANGGGVIMTADVANALTATAVNNSGMITAQSARNENGVILLLAKGGDIENSGTLDASAAGAGVAGGKIIIRGDGVTRLDPTSVIDTSGNQARGGFIELSGHQLAVRGNVTAGRQGTLLIDPSVIHITNTGTHSSVSVGTGTIGTGFIVNKLNAGSNVEIVASNSISNTTGTGITATGTGNLTIATGTVGGATCGIGGICFGSGAPSIGHNAGTVNLGGLPINIAGKVSIDAAGNADSGGNITAVSIKGKAIDLTADQISVNGNLTATGGDINLFAHSGNPDVTITGTVTANNGAFGASFSNEGGTGIGTLQVNKVTALGIHVDVGRFSASGTLHATGAVGNASTSRDVVIHAHGSSVESGPQIKTKKVVSDHGNINLVTQPGSFSPGSSVINIGGDLTAAGSVDVFTSGTSAHFGGNITVNGNITGRSVGITARGLGSNGGKITVNGDIISTGAHSNQGISISADNFLGNGVVTINGDITGGEGVTIRSQGGTAHLTVNGDIHANTHGCQSSDCAVRGVHLQANGGVVNMNGDITVDKDPFDVAQALISGASLHFGNITNLGGSIEIDAGTTAAGGAKIIQTTSGTLKAATINVDLNASYGGLINLANLTASSAAHPAGIEVTARSFQGGDQITVSGNIKVDGKGGRGFSSGMPGIGIGMPVGAYLVMTASGSAGAPSKVNVNGNISVTAHAGVANYNQAACGSGCETGPHHPGIHGQVTGGLAVVHIGAFGSASSVKLGAVTTVTGPDAQVDLDAKTVKAGAITVAGSGHTMALSFSNSFGPVGTNSVTNNIGAGVLRINGGNITTGNISVSGRGEAELAVQGTNIVMGNIAVAATAAHGSREGSFSAGTDGFARGLMGFGLGSGSFTAGRADVFIGGAGAFSSGSAAFHPDGQQLMGAITFPGTVANLIKVGTITATGVGEADVKLGAKNIQAKSITAVATKGSLVGTGTSSAGGEGTEFFDNTFNIQGGEAHIGLDGGLSSTSIINVAGDLTATGPTGGVDIEGHTVKVSGGISAVGSGGSINVKSVFHGFSSSYTLRFKGPGDITGVTVGGLTSTASVNIGGTVAVKGPGLVGVSITGQNVTLGALNASASAARNYSVLDTRDSTTPDAFTAGSVAMLVFEGDSSGITGAATITGNLTLNAAHGNVYLPGELTVGGTVTVTATGGITTDVSGIAPKFNEISTVIGGSSGSDGIPSGGIGPLTLKAAGVSLVAGGNIDLTSADITATGNLQVLGDGNVSLVDTSLKAGALNAIAGGSLDLSGATVTVINATQLVAGFNGNNNPLKAKDIILSGVNITTGVFEASAGGTIHNGGAIGTLKANALSILAGKDIDLSSTDITVGAGTVPGIPGDTTVIAGLTGAGIGPLSSAPNATFIAGGDLTLGDLSMTGSYLYLQAASVAILGKVTVPKGTVVQVAPIDPAATIGFEDKPAKGSDFNLSNSDFLSLFPQITLVLGTSAETGAATLAGNGNIDIGDDNLVVATSGTITGLEKVTSTGLVTSLLSILGPPVPPPTSSEIDPNSGNKKHGEQTGGVVVDTGTNQLIDHDNQPPAGTCH